MKKRLVTLCIALAMIFAMFSADFSSANAANTDNGNVILSIPWNLINQCGYQKESGPCMAYCWAYCHIILDNQPHSYQEYWDGTQAKGGGYNGKKDADTMTEMLRIVYDNINSGYPVVLHVRGTAIKDKNGNLTGKYNDHFVVAIGYRAGSDPDNLQQGDILILNPSSKAIDSSAGSKETYTYLNSCTLTQNRYWTAKSGTGGQTTTTSKGPDVTSNSSGKVIEVSSTADGSWFVTIPANYKLVCYTSANATKRAANYISAKTESYTLSCTKQATLSNGKTRYFFTSGDGKDLWFDFTSSMSVTPGTNWTQDKHTHTNGAYFYSDDHPHYKYYTCTTCGEVYTDGSTANMNSCSVCNPKPNTYTVTFNPDGGECSVDTMQTNADGKLSSLPVATRSNCTFGGWRMIVGGSELWRAVDTNTVFTKDTRVHAFWIYEPCTVFFDANGGTVSQSSKIVTADTPYGDLPTPTRSGYRFDGWYTKASGGILMTSNTGVESTADHTLYAHWSADPTPSTWSEWSAWSSTPYIASSTRQVETQQVKVSDSYTEYRYGRYVDGTGRNAGFCTTTLTKLGYSGITVQYSDWTTFQYPTKEKDWTCGFCSGTHTGVHHYSNDGRAWWKEYVSLQSGSFFWEESRQTDAVYETQYRYRDLISG